MLRHRTESYEICVLCREFDPFVMRPSLPFTLTVDSMGLWATVYTLHEGKDYRLRPVASRLRDCYEGGEIHTMMWIPGSKNIADVLTKRNLVAYRLLNDVLTSGIIPEALLQVINMVTASS